METLAAVKKLKAFFPDKYVSIKEEFASFVTGRIEQEYSGYVEGYDYASGFKSFEEVINHFTRKVIMDRTFNTHFIVKCGSEYCAALNKQF